MKSRKNIKRIQYRIGCKTCKKTFELVNSAVRHILDNRNSDHIGVMVFRAVQG